jgi:hypothetical protein
VSRDLCAVKLDDRPGLAEINQESDPCYVYSNFGGQ